MSGSINPISLDIGEKYLNALWERSNVISNNIANSDTPGYNEQSVSFEDQLSQALSGNGISESELANINPTVVTASGSGSSGGSSVDMEQQMVDLMKTQLEYNYMEQGVSSSLSLLKLAASDGKG